MTDTIEIQGKEYEVKRFTKAHLGSLIYAFRRSMTADWQSAFGQSLKRFFIPSISSDIVEEDFNESTQITFYTNYLEFDEMGEIVESLIEIAKERGLISGESVEVTLDVDEIEELPPPSKKAKSRLTSDKRGI